MTARNTIFLEPSRILPPLVSSIVEDHQVGVIVPVEELLTVQAQNGKFCRNRQYFHWVTPFMIQNKKSLMPGKNYWQKGQMSSCWIALGFNQRHRDLLQKQLDVPVLLSNVLIARLAAELLV